MINATGYQNWLYGGAGNDQITVTGLHGSQNWIHTGDGANHVYANGMGQFVVNGGANADMMVLGQQPMNGALVEANLAGGADVMRPTPTKFYTV